MKDSFETSYDLVFGDFVAADRLVLRHCKQAGRTVRFIGLYGPISGAAWALYGAYRFFVQHKTLPFYVIGLAVAGAYIATIGPFFRTKQLRKTWNSLLPKEPDFVPITFAFDNLQVSMIHRGRSEYNHLWSSVQGLAEDEKMLVLFISKQNYFYVPKRFLNDEALDSIYSHIRTNNSNFSC